MNRKLNRIALPLVSFVALVALACTCGNIGTPPTPTPAPTLTERPTAVPTTEPIATKPPIGGSSDGGAITLSDTPFVYSSGAFSITFPAGWEVVDYDHGAFSTSPDGVAAVGVVFENTGVILEGDALALYIESYEFNRYAIYPNYVQSSNELQDDGSTAVFKTLENNGVTFDVATYYWQDGTTMFVEDWWVSSDQYDTLSDGLLEVINSMTWDGSVAENETVYFHKYLYTCPYDVCTFNVPFGWWHTHTDDGQIVADDFTSPLGDSRIQYFTYAANTSISSEQARGLADITLKILTGTEDFVVTDEQVLSDGSTNLEWTALTTPDLSGVSHYETRDSTFYMLSWRVNFDMMPLYYLMWNEIVDSYQSP